MRWLVDTDVLFAAINRAHERHATSRRWLESVKADGWGVAVETYLASVRLLMNVQVMKGHALGAVDALRAVRAEFTGAQAGQIVAGGNPDDAFLRQAQRHRQIMDFYLVQIAASQRATLATRDRGTLAAWPEHTFAVV
jgi:predicted nucleic acid-binding protein